MKLGLSGAIPAARATPDPLEPLPPPSTLVASRSPASRRWPGWTLILALAALAGLAALALAVAPRIQSRGDAIPSSFEMRFTIVTPPGTDPVSLAVSPDGRHVVFAGDDEGGPRLWMRSMNASTARPIDGTRGGSQPFWSPDSRHLAFFADGMLRRIGIAPGSAQSLANAPRPCGGTWTTDGAIVFVPDCDGPMVRVAATGGDVQPVTSVELGRESGHRFPQALPGGRHVLFFASGPPDARGVHVIDLRSGEQRRLIDADSAAVYAAPGYLLFARQGALLAQQLDVRSLEVGQVAVMSEDIALDPVRRAVAVAASGAGIIVYRTGGGGNLRQLLLLDREGGAMALAEPDSIGFPRASRDGRRVAYSREVNGNVDIWILDVGRQVTGRFTFDAGGDTGPVWSPDGQTLVFHSSREGQGVFRKASDGSGPETLLFRRGHRETVTDWSEDGRLLLFHHRRPGSSWDVSAMPTDGGGKAIPILQSEFDELGARFSPDARWIAYQTNESGRFEIFVRRVFLDRTNSDGDVRAQVTSEGGTDVRWSRDGRTLFYVAPDGMLMSLGLAFRTASAVEFGRPIPTGVRLPAASGEAVPYDVIPSGFVAALPARDEQHPLTVLLNWRPGH